MAVEPRPVRDVRRFESAGFRLVTADVAEAPARAHLLPDPSAVAAAGVPVHANLYRAAARVEVPGLGSLLLKVHRPRGLADRLRAALRASRARAEWDAARFLEGAGVPTPELLVLAERRRGFVVEQAATAARFLPARETFAPALRAQPAAKAHALLVRAARWVRAMHDRGISHGDLHSGNVLVGPGPGDRAEIHVVDLHTVRTGRPVSPCVREAQLARWLHSLASVAGPGGRLRSLRAYLGDDVARKVLGPAHARIERLVARRERTRVRSRSRRAVEESGTFTREMGGDVGRRRRDLSLASLEAALAAHDRAIAGRGASLLKAGPKSVVTRTPVAVVKERRSPTLARRIEDACLPRRARRGYENAHGLLVRGIATAAPLAFVRRKGRTFTLYRDLSPYPRLDHRVRDALRRGDWSRRRLGEIATALADVAARLHRRGIWHGDWKACNFLIEEHGREVVFHLIDTDRVRFRGALSIGRRLRNLAQLAASLPRVVSRTDRLRWFRRYAKGTPLEAPAAERAALRGVARLVAAKIVVVDEPIE